MACKRKADETITASDDASSNFVPVISLETPLADYIQLIRTYVQSESFISDDMIKENFEKIARVARDTIWRLLFGADNDNVNTEQQLAKATEILQEHKCDASFFGPWEYNDWILNVRDELLKRKMFDYWREVIVKKELGPCWARDSDLFDDMDDPEPAEFYKHAGCVAPFEEEAELDELINEVQSETTDALETEQNIEIGTAALALHKHDETTASSADIKTLLDDFDTKISLSKPLADYQELMRKYAHLSDSVKCDTKEYFRKIAKTAQDAIWQLLFGLPTEQQQQVHQPSKVDSDNAAALLKAYKGDACFEDPLFYNNWIVDLRNELLKRKFFDFWRNVIVKDALGPCCDRDSDYFDFTDPRPVKFYEHAGCVAPFKEVDDDDDVEAATT